jgi:hypothetical protein
MLALMPLKSRKARSSHQTFFAREVVRDALGQPPQTSDLAGWLAECDGVAEAFDILKDLLMIGVKLGNKYAIIGGPVDRLHESILG